MPCAELHVKPDFIIAGTMKSGTTSLHHLLEHHSRIFMPEGEVQLFAIDDIEQNPVFFAHVGREWSYQHFETYFDEYNTWHQSLYTGAQPGQVLGEDAPSYLPSRQAIDRIAAHVPDVKLLVMLRDPVKRLYSQYWHWVRTYRALYSLEDTIRFHPGNLLQRSYYEEQLAYCFEKLSPDQVHVILFEEFIQNQAAVLRDVLAFLGLEEEPVRTPDGVHSNKGRTPRFLKLALLRNRFLRDLYGKKYQGAWPRMPSRRPPSKAAALAVRLSRIVNPETHRSPAPMAPETRRFLTQLLRDRNAGLPGLLDRDLGAYWPTFQHAG